MGLVHGATTIALRKTLGFRANELRHGLPLPPFHPVPVPYDKDAGIYAAEVAVVLRVTTLLSAVASSCPGDLLGYSDVWAPPSPSPLPLQHQALSLAWPEEALLKRLSRTFSSSGEDMLLPKRYLACGVKPRTRAAQVSCSGVCSTSAVLRKSVCE